MSLRLQWVQLSRRTAESPPDYDQRPDEKNAPKDPLDGQNPFGLDRYPQAEGVGHIAQKLKERDEAEPGHLSFG